MATFTPKTDKELNDERLLTKGEYSFDVIDAIEKKSQRTGAPMFELKVGVFDANGNQRIINDYLVFTDSAMFKVSKFSKAVGMHGQYKSGHMLPSDCIGRSGKCKIDIEPEGQYPAKNKITDYVIPKVEKEPESIPKQTPPPKAATRPAPVPPDAEDDVPF